MLGELGRAKGVSQALIVVSPGDRRLRSLLEEMSFRRIDLFNAGKRLTPAQFFPCGTAGVLRRAGALHFFPAAHQHFINPRLLEPDQRRRAGFRVIDPIVPAQSTYGFSIMFLPN